LYIVDWHRPWHEQARASASHAKALVTFNRRHFDPPPLGVMIVEPSDPA